MSNGVFKEDLVTSVRRLEYDFELRAGFLYLPPSCCTDMGGCIKLFQAIDPEVSLIYTFEGGVQGTIYERVGTIYERNDQRWRAVVRANAN